jgi:hypothetical protein
MARISLARSGRLACVRCLTVMFAHRAVRVCAVVNSISAARGRLDRVPASSALAWRPLLQVARRSPDDVNARVRADPSCRAGVQRGRRP